ncbi:MAG: SSI family serine proteinase inhibitor [Actinoallomurus sp.]
MSPASIKPVAERTPPTPADQDAGVPANPNLTPGAPSAWWIAASPSPSAGPDADQARQAPTRLTLRTVVGSAAPRTVSLQCDPSGGTHPKAAQACADLGKAHNDFVVAMDDKNPRACFMIYSPVMISAEGQWHGEAVRFTARYPNTCVLRAKTASIFDF